MPKIVTTPEAFADIRSVVDGYEALVGGLGRRFKRDLKKSLQIIRRHPDGYADVFEGFRLAPIGKFPHVIAYVSASDAITVYAVFHPAQDPKNWQKRLGRK